MEGNQNEMRDVLLKLRAEIGLFYNNEWIPHDAWQGCDDMISHALSEPPRNCDVGMVEEQESRYERFCDSHKWVDDEGVNACSSDCPLYNTSECALHWAQFPCNQVCGK